MTTITVRELKAKASEILRNLESSREEVIITRRGKPCGKLVPWRDEQQGTKSLRSLRGALSFLPDANFQDFVEVKDVWEPRVPPGHDQ